MIFGGQKYDFIMGGISITIQTLLQSGKYLDFDLSVETQPTHLQNFTGIEVDA
jgi:hypothetical protein